MLEISYLDAPNPILQVLFSLFPFALPKHYAWRSRLKVDSTIKLLGRLGNGTNLFAG